MAATIKVGTRFTKSGSRRYTERDGSQGTHEYLDLCEVTSLDSIGFAYTVVQRLSETGRPSFGTTVSNGSMAWFGWHAAAARGDVALTD